MRRVLALAGALAVMAVFAPPANAAAPDYILVDCPGTKRGVVVLASWDENAALLLSLAAAPRANRTVRRALLRRPRCDLAEFWGWHDQPRPTRPSQANQHGRFYPARRRQPAVFVVMVDGIKIPRIAPARALRILARHGVPTRLRG